MELKDSDRVVFVGGTFFEREAQLGYIETALTARFPDRNVTFRNLGYAGDTVTCNARTLCSGFATFGPPDQGMNRLKALIEEIKPTVIFVGYGMTESFDGEKKLPDFVSNYGKLLDMLTTAAGGDPRLVLVSPNYHEDLGRPFPDPASHNDELRKYCEAIGVIAAKRHGMFIDLFTPEEKRQAAAKQSPTTQKGLPRSTSNGIHLTPLGYCSVAIEIEKQLGWWQTRMATIEVTAAGNVEKAERTKVSQVVKRDDGGLSFTATDELLTHPQVTEGQTTIEAQSPVLRVTGLPNGRYSLKAQNEVLATASAEEWVQGAPGDPRTRGVTFTGGPSIKQANQLRKLIVAKNADFFNYWRPENDTYILGYRQKEQGKNAVELPKFKPLAESKDAEIAKLRVPIAITYTLEKQ